MGMLAFPSDTHISPYKVRSLKASMYIKEKMYDLGEIAILIKVVNPLSPY